MARAILLGAGVVWMVAGIGGLAVAIAGTDMLSELLPPLVISGAALARTVAALAVAALTVGAVHLGVAIGLARRSEWAASGGILLAGVACAAFLALAAASLTAGASGSMLTAAALASAAGCLAAASAYGVACLVLVRRHGVRGPV